jgi:hypothetical protein
VNLPAREVWLIHFSSAVILLTNEFNVILFKSAATVNGSFKNAATKRNTKTTTATTTI